MKQTKLVLRNLIYFTLTLLGGAWMSSCSSTETVDPQKMNDTSGLNIDLEWTTGSSIAQSLSDVDLDLKLMKGTNVVDYSVYYSDFERVELKDIYADGEYTVVISFETGKKGANYTVYINGIQSGKSKQYDGNVSVSEVGATIEFIKITKKGTEYSFSK